MKTLLAILLVASTTTAYARCFSSTFVNGYKVTVCTTCCTPAGCMTTCL